MPYFEPKKWELNYNIYSYLGITIFKKITLYIYNLTQKLDKHPSQYYNIQGKGLKAILAYEEKTRAFEKMHLFAIVVLLFLLVEPVAGFSNSIIYCTLCINMYALILQRYNRARIYVVLKKYHPKVLQVYKN
ncbi:hypothetical protein ACG2LH_12635 [Zhouia sp. PK063]|uniref:glycosyl-4,4'-diaponeurosporenoate acyltransferase CrtO family protein n=1 Tax=Zhouia sp. PK063 TaxID=3373602 RepID=UPI00378C08CB